MRKLRRYDEMKATSLNAEQINALIEFLALAKTNMENYINTKCEIFGICAQQQIDAAIELLYENGDDIDAAIELLYEDDETRWRR